MMPWTDLLYVNLGWGRDRARSIGSLSEAMGAPRRAIEKAVEELRSSGSPVCTGSDGVWLTTDENELVAQYRALRRRYIRQAVNARVLLATAKRYAKVRQMEMFG